MDSEEVRNKLLAEIHNRLAEISKFLEIGIAMLAKLDSYELNALKTECKKVIIEAVNRYEDEYSMSQDIDRDVGCNSSKGLYLTFWNKGMRREDFPLGEDDKRLWPVDEEEGHFLTDSEVAALQKQKEAE